MVRARLPILNERPTKRGECVDGMRPCPWVSCRYHLLLDIGSDGRLLKSVGFDERNEESVVNALSGMGETCSLDVADRGGVEASYISDLLGLSSKGLRSPSRDRPMRVQGTTFKRNDVVNQIIRRAGELLDKEDFEELEHPEDFYIRYSNAGADELAEITAELRARQKGQKRG